MSTPQSTNTNASGISKDFYAQINQSTSQWINFDHDPTDSDDIDDEISQYNNSENKPSLNNDNYPLHIVQKRVLFVSLIQLYRSYKTIPSFILENALFTFGIKRSWLFPQTQSEITESKNAYIQHFISDWSTQFMQIIKDKDKKGHVLWIEPCNNNIQTKQFWNKISNQLTTITDLSVSQHINKSKNKHNNNNEITDILEHSNQNVQSTDNNNNNNNLNIIDINDNKSRPSQSDIFTDTKNTKNNNNNNTKILSISQQILNPSQAMSGFTFTQDLYTDDEDDVSSDSDFEDDKKTISSQKHTDTLDKPDEIFEDKSRPSQHDLFTSIYYSPLRLDKNWWKNKYEKCRKMQRIQTDKKMINDIVSFKICVTNSFEIISKFNIYADDIIRQIECIGKAEDFQFGPLKELFYQSNPTLIPMDNFDINIYIESHSNMNDKYTELLNYCNKYLYPLNNNIKSITYGHDDDDGHESDYSISMDIIQHKSLGSVSNASNSMLPFHGKIPGDGNDSPVLFDSEDNKPKIQLNVSVSIPNNEISHKDKCTAKVIEPKEIKTQNDNNMVCLYGDEDDDDLYGDEDDDDADNEMSGNHDSESILSNLSNSELPFGGKIRSEFDLDHLEYYLSNTVKVSCSKNDGNNENSNEQSHKSSDKSKSKSDEKDNELGLPTLHNKHTVHLSDHRLNLTQHEEEKYTHEELVVNMNENNGKKKGMKKRKSKMKNIGLDNYSIWCYEPLGKYRAKGNILISKMLTNDIIPNMIKENICNLWQFMDKISAMLKDCGCLIKWIKCLNKKIKVINYGFHGKINGDKLYCVLEENLNNNINYKWIMMEKLYDYNTLEKEYKIKKDNLPKSIYDTMEYESNILNINKIKNIIENKTQMNGIILKTKWHKISIKNKIKLNKKRMTLSMNKEEFIKSLQIMNDNKNDIHLVPIIMFNHKNINKYRMEYIWIVRIDKDIDIGISLVYNDKNRHNPLQITSIHLNKMYIYNQCQLVSNGNDKYFQCLEQFTSVITNLNIGNPDDAKNRIKDLQRRNSVLKQEKEHLRLLNEQLNAKNEELQKFKDLIMQITSKNVNNTTIQIPNTINMNPFCNQLIIPIQSSTTNNIILPQMQNIQNMQNMQNMQNIRSVYPYSIILQNNNSNKNNNNNNVNSKK